MDDLIKRLHQGKSCYVGTPAAQLTAVDEYGILCLEAAAALSEAHATIARQQVMLDRALENNGGLMIENARMKEENARLMSLEGAADRVLRFITNPDWADQNSEIFRTTPWQALYNEMRQDKDDFPALVRTFLEAFTCKDFREELAALTPREGEGT